MASVNAHPSSNEVTLKGGYVNVKGIGSFHYSAPFENLIMTEDVSTVVTEQNWSDPSIPIKIIDFKRAAIFVDFKNATDAVLRFEVSPTGYSEDDWFLLEEKEFSQISEKNQYFLLADGKDICANYMRVKVKNTGAADMTLPYIRAVMRG